MQEELKSEYLPLFRKYRPQSFKDVIGQEFTVQALTNAIKLNKIANAYLFCGPRGTGKTSSARIFAKSLNCKEGPTVEPCQKCQSCQDVTNASGIDVIEIDAATNRGIDDAKELINKVQYAPMNGKYKIFIIDEVHMLSKEAFNALLKTFEEPPKNVIFILATTEPHKVIETIVSRCQRFDFRRITIDDIVKRLRQISDLEKINITDEALFAIAKNVSGGMRDSLALLDQASILGIEKEITKDVIESLIGKLTFDTLYDLLDCILKGDIENSVKKLDNIYEKGSEPRNFVENFIEFLRNIILIATSSDIKNLTELTLINKDNIQKIKENKNFTKEKLVQILDKTIEIYKEIKASTNPYLWAELLVINLSSIDLIKEEIKTIPVQNIQTIKAEVPKVQETVKVKEPEIKKEIIKEEVPKSIDAAAKPKPDDTIENAPVKTNNASRTLSGDPVQVWGSIINNIESIPAKFFYSGLGKLIGITNNCITLGFVNENALTQAKSENKYPHLLKAIKKVLGENSNIEFVIITGNTKIIETKVKPIVKEVPQQKEIQTSKNESLNSATSPMQPTIKEDIKDSPEENTENYSKTTREMLETFGGRVVE